MYQRTMRQMTLGKPFRVRTEHGGDKCKGKRKLARPVTTKRPMHVVLRSSEARGQHSMLSPKFTKRIEERLYADAAKNQVKVRGYVNVGNHLHLIVQPRTKAGFQRFLRTFSGVVARIVTGARRGQAHGHGAGRAFWDALAYSRVVEWGKAYASLHQYLRLNSAEAAGGTRARGALKRAFARYGRLLAAAEKAFAQRV